MAASDSTYRNIKTLHVVFAVSSLVMLATIIGMFAKDFYRPWKVEQRLFFDVEEEMAKRQLLAASPTEEQVDEIASLEAELAAKRSELTTRRQQFEKSLGDLPARKLKTETERATVKADVDSVQSFINAAAERNEEGLSAAEALRWKARLDELTARLNQLTEEVQKNQAEYDARLKEAGIPELEEQIARLERRHKELLGDFDRFAKLVSQKRWSAGEWLRSRPIIEGFASPVRINQYTLTDLPIDYSFKHVTRFDRCTTCHLGMEKANYDAASLASLTENPNLDKDLASRLRGAKKIIEKRREAGVRDLPSEREIQPRQISAEELTPGRIRQFAAHPRLDLYVDAASPHSAEKFGCTICHSGQGSATAFYEASHFPNSAPQKKDWKEKYDWKTNHYWDFPMVPSRFVESSCVKCHHEITDLIRYGNQVEAPKLVKGYNLVKELGCFGCHEIAGIKSGKKVGPDLRLEPDPAMEFRSPAEQAMLSADPLNPPGTLRKVGPSLNRLAEKTNEEWVRLWLKSPRGFRPSTKMPHFYLQPNNRPENLPDDQKLFPDNEIHAVAHYLVAKSKAHIDEIKRFAEESPDAAQADASKVTQLQQGIQAAEAELKTAAGATAEPIRERLSALKHELAAVESRIKRRDQLRGLAPPTAMQQLPAQADVTRGRVLFQEKGCLACHSHEATETPGGEHDGKPIPALVGDATFAPDLSRLAHKLVPEIGGPENARRWLVSWILDPAAHNPRTVMPDTQLSLDEANDVAAWLLSQKPAWERSAEEEVAPVDLRTLADMTEMYLKKVLTVAEVRDVLRRDANGIPTGGFTVRRLKEIAGSNPDSDELELGGDLHGKNDDEVIPLDEHKLKMYVGKKAIGNLGCYACHSIPGFQNAKPIGTGLNDWGKKDIERLAFEDGHKFVEQHFHIVASRDGEKGKNGGESFTIKDGKKPYEQFFLDMLDHHGRSREGFLHLKLEEPRSYDYNRIRSWDERLRMPQFKFARPRRLPNESREEYEARTIKEEAEAREAVMTFILGLVAESIPSSYVHRPKDDRWHEVKGRQVLDKFNCGGCHLIRPGSLEFKSAPIFDRLENGPPNPHPDLYKHEGPYTKDDYFDPSHIAWAGLDQGNAPRSKMFGVHPPLEVKSEEDDEPSTNVGFWLMRALRFRHDQKKDGSLRDIPAAAQLSLPPNLITKTIPPYGGEFMDQLVQYLQRRDRENYGGGGAKLSLAYAAAPPNLIGEGEKAQPDWLYNFLRNPHPIRPLAVLRMPKFNLSPDDTQAIVNYFSAVDRMENRGIGLTYPYVAMPQRTEGYLKQKTAEYVARLKASGQYEARKQEFQRHWEEKLAAEKAAAERALKEAEEQLKSAPEASKADAQKLRDEAKRKADLATERFNKKDVSELVRRWEEREAYIADASRLVLHGNLCLTCHYVGDVAGKENKGPNLELVAERLRPDWVRRWVTNPQRFLHYTTVMPINFLSTKTDHQDAFVGSSWDQIHAVRDFLMLYPEVRTWPIIRGRPMLGTGSSATTTAAAGGGE
ncbi:MAG: c-type cytochrome [Gemmataceae bacterium]|nr:c-type cytochrome [Gemmataceae bacterium]